MTLLPPKAGLSHLKQRDHEDTSINIRDINSRFLSSCLKKKRSIQTLEWNVNHTEWLWMGAIKCLAAFFLLKQ